MDDSQWTDVQSTPPLSAPGATPSNGDNSICSVIGCDQAHGKSKLDDHGTYDASLCAVCIGNHCSTHDDNTKWVSYTCVFCKNDVHRTLAQSKKKNTDMPCQVSHIPPDGTPSNADLYTIGVQAYSIIQNWKESKRPITFGHMTRTLTSVCAPSMDLLTNDQVKQWNEYYRSMVRQLLRTDILCVLSHNEDGICQSIGISRDLNVTAKYGKRNDNLITTTVKHNHSESKQSKTRGPPPGYRSGLFEKKKKTTPTNPLKPIIPADNKKRQKVHNQLPSRCGELEENTGRRKRLRVPVPGTRRSVRLSQEDQQ
jgi:hypothetical protein